MDKDVAVLQTEERAPSIVETMASSELMELAETAERRVDAMIRIRKAVIRLTSIDDWVDFGGKPYLDASGAEKIGRAFGISWDVPEPHREDHGDGHYTYKTTGTFSFRGNQITFTGARASDDNFFGTAKGQPVPPEQIDHNDVMKACQTNCIGNGVTRLLGVRNLSWEELEGAGIKRSAMAGVAFVQKIPFGDYKDRKLNDPDIPVSELERLLRIKEQDLKDPNKAKYRQKDEAFAAALMNAIHVRKDAARSASMPKEPTGQQARQALPPHPPLSHTEDEAIPTDEEWSKKMAYMDGDLARKAIKAKVKAKLKVDSLHDLHGEERLIFLRTLRDFAKVAGLAMEV